MDKKNNPWRHGIDQSNLFREEQILPSITTYAIEATIEFDSFGQVDSTQAFHVALLVDGWNLRNCLPDGNFSTRHA